MRIRTEMNILGIKQKDMVKRLGENQSAVAKWLSENDDIRNDIPISVLSKIAYILNVDVAYLIGSQDEKRIDPSNGVTFIPVVNIAAGAGAEGLLPEYITEERVPIWTKFLNGINPKNLSIFQVVGDSMEPTIRPEDWVIVDMVNSRSVEMVDSIYLISKDGSIQIKRLHFRGSKGVDIISDNKEYPTENTILNNIELHILGKLYKHVRSLGSLAEK